MDPQMPDQLPPPTAEETRAARARLFALLRDDAPAPQAVPPQWSGAPSVSDFLRQSAGRSLASRRLGGPLRRLMGRTPPES